MSRSSRKKAPEAIYHCTSRSITEFSMFPSNADKEHFLDLIYDLKEKYHCKIYAYCLMTTHYHIIIDTCGYDISRFMKGLNQEFVRFINRKYKRRGHLLAERFYSKILDSTEYLFTASSYIHNNPKDLPEYAGKVFEYPYSSMGIYLGISSKRKNLIDTDFILNCLNNKDKIKATRLYEEIVTGLRSDNGSYKVKEYLNEYEKEQYEYKSYREIFLRNKSPQEVIAIISRKLEINDVTQLMIKNRKKTILFRRLVAYALNVFCGLRLNEVCKHLCNITVSCCSKLVKQGYIETSKNLYYRNMLLQIKQ